MNNERIAFLCIDWRHAGKRASLLAFLFLTAAAGAQPRQPSAASQPSRADVDRTMARGIAFLLKDQNADGSWGGWRNASDEFWSNIETHRSWIVATTGLCCMALSEAGGTEEALRAADRGIDYVVKNALVKRPSEWDVDNTWGYIYGLQSLARAYRDPHYKDSPVRDEIRKVVPQILDKLRLYQTPSGGWGYYDFDAYTRTPAWATSFMTSAAVLALLDAREAGFAVDAKMLGTAVKAVKHARLPSGAYTYSIEAITSPGHSEWIDNVKGSLGRIQVGNLALRRAGEPISDEDLTKGLAVFFKEHRFLDCARMRPIPHEAYYLNAGYFYFFGHYYAAQVIEQLPAGQRAAWFAKLQPEIVKTQESDGSMWDYYMNAYHRPYGTAFGMMALVRTTKGGDAK